MSRKEPSVMRERKTTGVNRRDFLKRTGAFTLASGSLAALGADFYWMPGEMAVHRGVVQSLKETLNPGSCESGFPAARPLFRIRLPIRTLEYFDANP
jgi:hypothetical protein